MKPCLVLLLTLLISCTATPTNHYFDVPPMPIEEATPNATVTALVSYLHSHIEWEPNPYPKTPNETWATGKGSCFDQSVLAMYIIYRDLAIKPHLVVGYPYDPTKNGHAWLQINETLYDVTRGTKLPNPHPYHYIYLFTYDYIMERATSRTSQLNTFYAEPWRES